MGTQLQTGMDWDVETAKLQDGTAVRLRQIRPGDKAMLNDAVRRLSPRSRYHRFASAARELSAQDLEYLTGVDNTNHVAWVAIATVDGKDRVVGVARFVRLDKDPASAEVAVMVADSHQGRGLGMVLLGKLAESARINGVQRFLAYVCCDNAPILKLVREFGAGVRFMGSGMVRVTGAVPENLKSVAPVSY